MNIAVSNLLEKLNNFPKNSQDLNILCSSIYSSYISLKSLMENYVVFQGNILKDMKTSLNLVDDQTYDDIMKKLSYLNITTQSVSSNTIQSNLSINSNVAKTGDLLSEVCTDFLQSLPTEILSVIQDVKYDINKNSEIPLSKGMVNRFAIALSQLKDDTLREVLGDSFDTIILPFIDYQNFITDNGIWKSLQQMEKIESCMTKPGICNRNKSDFMINNKYFSSYYRNLFLISTTGVFSIKLIDGDSIKKTRVSNILKSLNSYRVSTR